MSFLTNSTLLCKIVPEPPYVGVGSSVKQAKTRLPGPVNAPFILCSFLDILHDKCQRDRGCWANIPVTVPLLSASSQVGRVMWLVLAANRCDYEWCVSFPGQGIDKLPQRLIWIHVEMPSLGHWGTHGGKLLSRVIWTHSRLFVSKKENSVITTEILFISVSSEPEDCLAQSRCLIDYLWNEWTREKCSVHGHGWNPRLDGNWVLPGAAWELGESRGLADWDGGSIVLKENRWKWKRKAYACSVP